MNSVDASEGSKARNCWFVRKGQVLMIEGFYISSYFDTGPLKNVLDVRLRHDHGMALWHLSKGQLSLSRYWEFERISGMKQHQHAIYDEAAAKNLVSDLLSEEGLNLGDIVEIWGTPALETSRGYLQQFDQSYAFHGIAHLMTALFYKNSSPGSSPIIAMSLDGGPDTLFEANARARHYYPGCVIDEHGMRLFHCESPGRLWSYAKTLFGLREGTLMALASASSAEVSFDLSKFDPLSFLDVETRISAPHVLNTLMAHVEDSERRGDWMTPPDDDRLSPLEHRISAIMKIVSELSLRIVKRNIYRIEQDFGVDIGSSRLGLAGGFALNCPTNSILIRDLSPAGYQIPPCASDSGLALGVGLAAFFPALRDGRISTELNSPYFGQSLGSLDDEIRLVEPLIVEIASISVDEVVSLLITEGIIAWVNGYAEIGPRALGNRSLLADPRSHQVKERLNLVKKRQWWRPVAPIVLHSEGDKYFQDYQFSPFMVLNFEATGLARRTVPGVLHLDGTARVQSVTDRTNVGLFHLLWGFVRGTGIPILGNTSLNDAGEPIVNRLSEAVHFAAGKGIRHLIVNSTTVIRLRDTRSTYTGPLTRQRKRFGPPSDLDQDKLVSEENPHGLTRIELAHYFDNRSTFAGLDLRVARDAAGIREHTRSYMEKYPGAYDRG